MQISVREKRLLSAGATVALVYFACTLLIFPYWDRLSESGERIDTQAKRLVNYRKILLGNNTVKAALSEAERQVSDAEKGLLTNSSDSLAAAEFQGLVKQLSTAQSLAILRTEALPVKPVSREYGKLSVRLEVSGPIDRFVGLMASFDASEKTMFVEDMRISPTHINAPKKKDLRATLTVSALKWLARPVTPAVKKS
ncbi:MAG: type II secretion system protein GspM [Terriglobia bacterium]